MIGAVDGAGDFVFGECGFHFEAALFESVLRIKSAMLCRASSISC